MVIVSIRASYCAGTANINQLTNIAVAAASGVNDPSMVWNDPTSYPITEDNLDQAVADIQTLLAPLLNEYNANIDFLAGNYTADHTGIDGLLDVIEVELDSDTGLVSVTDMISGNQIGEATLDNLANPTDTITVDEAEDSSSVPTDIQQIADMFSSFAAQLNKGISLTEADLEPFYANNFGIHSGINRTNEINGMIQNSPAINNPITAFTNLSIRGTTNNGDYIIDFVAYFDDGSFGSPNEMWNVTKENGSWKFIGNGFMSKLCGDGAVTHKYIAGNGIEVIESGLSFHLHDDGNNDLQRAVVVSQAYPGGQITLSRQGSIDTLEPDLAYVNSYDWDFYRLTDAEIDQIPDNVSMTIYIYDSNNDLVGLET